MMVGHAKHVWRLNGDGNVVFRRGRGYRYRITIPAWWQQSESRSSTTIGRVIRKTGSVIGATLVLEASAVVSEARNKTLGHEVVFVWNGSDGFLGDECWFCDEGRGRGQSPPPVARIGEPHRVQPHSLPLCLFLFARHVRRWGREGFPRPGPGCLAPRLGSTAGALKRRPSERSAKRASQPHALVVARRVDWPGSLYPDGWMAVVSSIGSESRNRLSL